jgi:protein-S-isoprenylcysteine O-methyltransferase Ste14
VRIAIPILFAVAGALMLALAPHKAARTAAALLVATGLLFLVSVSHCPSGTCTSATPWWVSAAGSLAGICLIGAIISIVTEVGQLLLHRARGDGAPR